MLPAKNLKLRDAQRRFPEMSNRRKVVILSIILSLLFVFTGCSKTNSGSQNTANTQYKKIIVGSDKFEPYIYQDDQGNFTGIDVELAREAFHRMGYEPEFKAIVWENKKEYLADGKVDCLWGCFSMNRREDEYQWAGSYLYSSQVVAVRLDSDIYQISDLMEKTVAVQETGKAEEYLLRSDRSKVPKVAKVYAFSNMDEVYSALRKNYVQAICGHESALNSFVQTAPDKYRILEEALFSSKLGVAFDKNYDKKFVEQLNDMLKDGTTKKIIERYHLDAEKALKEESE